MFDTTFPQTLHSAFGSWQCMCFLRLLSVKNLFPQVLHSNKRSFKWTRVKWSTMKCLRVKDFGHMSQIHAAFRCLLQCVRNVLRWWHLIPHVSQMNGPVLFRTITASKKNLNVIQPSRFDLVKCLQSLLSKIPCVFTWSLFQWSFKSNSWANPFLQTGQEVSPTLCSRWWCFNKYIVL